MKTIGFLLSFGSFHYYGCVPNNQVYECSHLIGTVYHSRNEQMHRYSIIFFYGNFGPNTTTFLLPAVTYEVEVRSTLNGVSAAMGKLGASIGAYAYEAIAKYVGEDVVCILIFSKEGCRLCILRASWL